MTIVEIKNCSRKDVPIYYRRVYTGIAVIENLGKIQNAMIDWTIETSPLGTSEINVTIADSIDYPLVPLIKKLKAKITELDTAGQLPL